MSNKIKEIIQSDYLKDRLIESISDSIHNLNLKEYHNTDNETYFHEHNEFYAEEIMSKLKEIFLPEEKSYLNKEERKAFNTLRNVLDKLEVNQDVTIKMNENNAIERVLGVNLLNISLRKKDVKETKRNKEKHLIIESTFGTGPRFPAYYCFFPYQIKEKK